MSPPKIAKSNFGGRNLEEKESDGTGFCRIFATGMFQTSSKCYDRTVFLWSRPIVLATTLPNKEGSWVFKVLLQRFCKTL